MKKKLSLSQVNSLKELRFVQRTFADIIRRPLAKKEKMLKDNRSNKMIEPNKVLTPHMRLELYAQQYWWRIQESFDEDFPMLRIVLGEKGYLKLRDAYLLKCPSTSFTLRNLGSRLPAFIKKHPNLTRPKTQLAFDSVVYDWAKIEAFDGASYPRLSKSLIQNSHFINLKIKLQPHVQLLLLQYNLHQSNEMFDVRKEEASNTALIRSKKAKAPKLSHTKRLRNYCVIHRYNGQLFTKICGKSEFDLLTALKKGCSLKQLLSKASVQLMNENEIFALFRDWTSLGWLYDIKKEK